MAPKDWKWQEFLCLLCSSKKGTTAGARAHANDGHIMSRGHLEKLKWEDGIWASLEDAGKFGERDVGGRLAAARAW